MGKNGLKNLVNEHLAVGETITAENLNALTHDIVTGSLEKRADAGKLTGEWIVFAKENGENIYLAIGTHSEPDEQLANNLRVTCVPEFPFLARYLTR